MWQKMKHKKGFILVLLCILTVFSSGYYFTRTYGFFNTSIEESLLIFTKINLQNDFAMANKIGLGNEQTKEKWQENYRTINTTYIQGEFHNLLPKEKVDALIKAEEKMNRKRKITVKVINSHANDAEVEISISKVNYSQIVEKAIQATRAQEKEKNAHQFALALADNLIKGYEKAQPLPEMTSFRVKCRRIIIDNSYRMNPHEVNGKMGRLTYWLVNHLGGHCWYPDDENAFYYQLNLAEES